MAARQYYSAEDLSETTASNAYTAKCTLTFTPDANSDYFIIASAQGSHDTTTGSVRVIIELEDPGNNTLWGCELKPQEYTSPKDWMSFFALGKYSAGASPSSITHRILFLSSSATTSRIKNARLIAIKASADDKFASNVNEASVSSSAWSTHTTLTFTPAQPGRLSGHRRRGDRLRYRRRPRRRPAESFDREHHLRRSRLLCEERL